MEQQNLERLVTQGLNAMHAGGEVAKKAAGSIQDDASDPQLSQALEQGQQTSAQWQQRLEQAMQKAGGQGGPNDNPVLEAHFEEAKRIRSEAPSDDARDLGIIAAGQQALHYWIASFGTMRSYTAQLGMDDVASDMDACAKEAGEADEKHTQLARRIMGSQSQSAAA